MELKTLYLIANLMKMLLFAPRILQVQMLYVQVLINSSKLMQ